jgi:D-glycero-alpha-D-manno-heptose-7-phosphate kinase
MASVAVAARTSPGIAAVDHSRGMVVTRTPLRVSFAGGGTDLAAFYEHEDGAVFSTAISRYVYVTVKRHGEVFDEQVRISYSRSETVDTVDEVENDIARECLKLLQIAPPIYVSIIGDLPASTGLGGSSAFAVGLLHALHTLRGERVTAGQLAEEAAQIEIDILGEPIGKQDQYASAFGGLNLFTFRHGGGVTVEPARRVNGALAELFEHTAMFWTGHQRDASKVLGEQQARTVDKLGTLRRMRDHAYELQESLRDGRFDARGFAAILDKSWQLKRGLASAITNSHIDDWHRRAMAAGALGGKLLGAGGGGFLLFIVEPQHRAALRAALPELVDVPVAPEAHGSRVVAGGDGR